MQRPRESKPRTEDLFLMLANQFRSRLKLTIRGISRTYFCHLSKTESSSVVRMAVSQSSAAITSATALPKNDELIREGLAEILIPAAAPRPLSVSNLNDGGKQQSVFYNPIQQFNRDLSVLAIKAFGEDLIALRQLRQRPRSKPKRVLIANRAGHSDHEENPHNVPNADPNDAHSAKRQKRTGHADIANIVDPICTNLNQPPRVEIQQANNYQLDPVALDCKYPEEDNADEIDTKNSSSGRPSIKRDQRDQNELQQDAEHAKPSSFRILDALSATGLRALRYAKEIPFVTFITANDLSAEATKSISANVAHNGLQNKVQVVTGNAMSLMYQLAGQVNNSSRIRVNKYDVVDLDPYGTAVPFLDAALHALNDGGLLCVTCTDSGVFNSVGYPEKAYALYGGTPIKGLHSHEGGLRLILHSIGSIAARYGISIEPLMSLSIDYYARVFVRVKKSPAEVKFLAGKTMIVYSCDSGCGAWATQYLARTHNSKTRDGSSIYKYGLAQAPVANTLCEHCGYKTHMSGPMYGGPIHNPLFLQKVLSYLPDLDEKIYETKGRIEGMLSTALEETQLYGSQNISTGSQQNMEITESSVIPRLDPALIDKHPFYFIPSALAKVVHCQAPSEAAVKGALRHSGYKAVRSHAKPGTIRTDAPWTFIWRMMKEWVIQKAPIKEAAVIPGTPGWAILKGLFHGAETDSPDGDQNKKRTIVFDEALGKERNAKRRLIRYQVNPRANWGPMGRAKAGKVGKPSTR